MHSLVDCSFARALGEVTLLSAVLCVSDSENGFKTALPALFNVKEEEIVVLAKSALEDETGILMAGDAEKKVSRREKNRKKCTETKYWMDGKIDIESS